MFSSRKKHRSASCKGCFIECRLGGRRVYPTPTTRVVCPPAATARRAPPAAPRSRSGRRTAPRTRAPNASTRGVNAFEPPAARRQRAPRWRRPARSASQDAVRAAFTSNSFTLARRALSFSSAVSSRACHAAAVCSAAASTSRARASFAATASASWCAPSTSAPPPASSPRGGLLGAHERVALVREADAQRVHPRLEHAEGPGLDRVRRGAPALAGAGLRGPTSACPRSPARRTG